MQELQSWLPAFVQLAHLPFDGRKEDSVVQDYLVRSQPAPACLSTMEAVARSALLSSQPLYTLHPIPCATGSICRQALKGSGAAGNTQAGVWK